MLYYKVCRYGSGNGFVSAGCVGQAYSNFAWNYPKFKDSKLFVFATLEDAKRFINGRYSSESYVVFSCEVKNPKGIKFICASGDFRSIQKFWEKRSKKKTVEFKMLAPEGTVICDALRLDTYMGAFNGSQLW